MKSGYTLKNLKKGLAIFALTLSLSVVSAQTVYTDAVVDPPAEMVFPEGAAQLTTPEIAAEGVTFKIQVTVTPGGTGTFVATNANKLIGIGSGGADNNPVILEGDEQESLILSDLTVIDFDPGTTGLDASAISDLHFHSINFRNAQSVADHPLITVNGDAPGTYDLGDLSVNFRVAFGVEFINNAVMPETFTVGDTSNVTEITLANGTTEPNDVYNLASITPSYTITGGITSLEEVVMKKSLSVYPTIVVNSFRVSEQFKTLQLIDLSGKTVKTFSASDYLEVSGLVSGQYIVKIQSEDGGIATGRLFVK